MMGPGAEIHIRTCINSNCRVETFKATHIIPFNNCPVCSMLGAVISQEPPK